MSKTYDFKALLDAYIQIPLRDYIHKDFRDFYTELVSKLEQLFGVKLEQSATIDRVLWSFFAEILVEIRKGSVGSHYLIGGPAQTLVLMERRENNEQAGIVFRKYIEAIKLDEAKRQKYLEVLHELFILFYGKIDKVFTSEDLLAIGFDDTKEPDIRDYYDYM